MGQNCSILGAEQTHLTPPNVQRARASIPGVRGTQSCLGIPIIPIVIAVTVGVIVQPDAVLLPSVGILNITRQNGLLGDWQVKKKDLAPMGLYNEMSLWPWLYYSAPKGSEHLLRYTSRGTCVPLRGCCLT